MPVPSTQGQRDFQSYLTKFAGGLNLCFLCLSTFSRWSRMPIGQKSCPGKPSPSATMNLFWWVRVERRELLRSAKGAVLLFPSLGRDALGKCCLKGGTNESGYPAQLWIHVMFLLSLQNLLLAKPLGLLSLLDEQSAFPQVWDRENDVGEVAINL